MSKPVIIKREDLVPFDPALCLLGVAWVQLPGEAANPVVFDHGVYQEVIKVQVPIGTTFMHASVVSSNMAFGSFTESVPSQLAAIRSDIEIKYKDKGVLDKDPQGFCTITFTAILQDGNLNPWTGWFLLEFMCFGKPQPKKQESDPES